MLILEVLSTIISLEQTTALVSLWFQKRLHICAVLYFEMPRIVFGNKDTDTKPLDILSYLENVDSEHDDIGCIEKNLRVIEQFEVKWEVN